MINPLFSDDFHKFVFQDPCPLVMPPFGTPKSFDISRPQKSKNDLKKEKSPWQPKPSEKESEKDF